MKVALSIEAITPVLTGIGRYTWELANRLPLVSDMSISYIHNGRWIEDPNVFLTETGEKAERQKQKILGVKIPAWYRKIQFSKNCKGKLFHGPNYFIPDCADLGIATVHDLSIFKFPETHPIERIKHFEKSFSSSMARASHLITDSESTRKEVIEFLSWPEEKITSIHLGASSAFSVKPYEAVADCLKRYDLQYDGYGLCVSTLEPRKKIDNLLTAYQMLPLSLRLSHPLVLIGGAGWLSDALHEKIAGMVKEGWLKYLGFVAEGDLPKLYAGARTFFYPSIYEGFGLPVLEAMKSGVPVVTSDRTSLPEVAQGAALLIEPDDIKAFASIVEKSLTDNIWLESAKEKGLAVAEKYSWNRCVEETATVYRNVLS